MESNEIRIINNLKSIVKLLISEYYDEQAVYVEEAIEALNKQIPIRPRSKTRHGTKQQTPQVLHWCSSCITMLHGKPHYCSHCGQAIKWD